MDPGLAPNLGHNFNMFWHIEDNQDYEDKKDDLFSLNDIIL